MVYKFCLIHLLSEQWGLQTVHCFADMRRYSCSQRSSSCDLVRSHKTSVAYCDHYCVRISPGKNIDALGNDDALVSISVFK